MGIGCFITVSTVLGCWQVYVDVVMLLLGAEDLALRNSVEGMAWVFLPIGIGLVLLGKYWQGKSEAGNMNLPQDRCLSSARRARGA